jgi:DNA-binding MarR family transcriptional regulator
MDDDLLDLFGAVANGFQARLQSLAAHDELGLAPFQARMLSLISRNVGCSQQVLAQWTGRDKAQVARTAKDLETRGLITRHAHQSDWRMQCLAVTIEGEKAAQLLNRQRVQAGAEMLENVSSEEREILHRVLSKMRSQLASNIGFAQVP